MKSDQKSGSSRFKSSKHIGALDLKAQKYSHLTTKSRFGYKIAQKIAILVIKEPNLVTLLTIEYVLYSARSGHVRKLKIETGNNLKMDENFEIHHGDCKYYYIFKFSRAFLARYSNFIFKVLLI